MSDFTCLFVHTHFSSTGGPASPDEWCAAASDLGYSSLGIADRGPLAGHPAFARAARKHGITPLFGMELSLALPGTSTSTSTSGPLLQSVVLFCKSPEGLPNLSRLAEAAYGEWPGKEKSLLLDDLLAHSAGLLFVLAPTGEGYGVPTYSDLPENLLLDLGSKVKAAFGDAAFVGVLPGSSEAVEDTGKAADAVRLLGLPPVAFTYARYLSGGAAAFRALRLARRDADWSQEPVGSGAVPSVEDQPEHLKSSGEARDLFTGDKEAWGNRGRIVDLCSGAASLFSGQAADAQGERATLLEVVEAKLRTLLQVETLSDGVKQRLDEELALAEKQGTLASWSGIRLLADLSLNMSMPLGAPLGSAEGSLLGFAFGISPLDPTPYARPTWLTAGDMVPLPAPGVEVAGSGHDKLIAALYRQIGAGRLFYAACTREITALAAVQAARQALGAPAAMIKDLALQVIEKDWSALQEECADAAVAGVQSLALALRGTPLGFKPDPDNLLVNALLPPDIYWPRLQGSAEGRSWIPWSEETLRALALPLIGVQPSYGLSILQGALSMASQRAVPGLDLTNVDLKRALILSEDAAGILARGETVGIPFMANPPKGWKPDARPGNAALLFALSWGVTPQKGYTPPNIAEWSEITEESGGLLLFFDQLTALAERVLNMSPSEAAHLRSRLGKHPEATRAQLKDLSMQHGVDEKEAEALCDAVAAQAPKLVSRYTAEARGRAAMWSALIKAAHPAALMSSALMQAWQRGGPAYVTPVAEEARRVGVTLLPVDVQQSLAAHGPERDGTGWAVRWGLSALAMWDSNIARAFVDNRPSAGFGTLLELCECAGSVGLSVAQVEMLLAAGGADNLGGVARNRAALLMALPVFMEWACKSVAGRDNAQLFDVATAQPDEQSTRLHAPHTPRARYAMRAWEREKLGIDFTPAPEMDALRNGLDASGGLRSRLATTRLIAAGEVGSSVYLIGLLCRIRLVDTDPGIAASGPLAVGSIEDMEGCIE
ncbi:MAG: PHP domain-containing protein, partial [Chloroflexota bacterium]|nr:PHP domain-containing protein [Chloroflexota bacterium]